MVFLGREIAEQKDYGDKIADLIDEEVSKIIDNAQAVARNILTKNESRLKYIAEKLIAQETLEADELEAVFTEAISTTKPEAKETLAPAPVTGEATAKPKPAPRKTPGISQPKLGPATP